MVAESTGLEVDLSIESTKQKAQDALARMINGRVVGGQLPNLSVTIGTGLDTGGYLGSSASSQQLEAVQITLKGPLIEAMPGKIKAAALAVAKEVPLFKDTQEFESPQEHVTRLKNQLKQFKAQGAEFPEKLIEWRGLNPDTAGTWRQAEDHALNINKSEFGYNVAITAQGGVKAIAENMRARLPEMKKALAERIIKYKCATDETAKCAIRQQVEQMEVKLNFTEPQSGTISDNGYITISFASPEQVLAEKNKNVPGAAPPDQLKLQATNIIDGLNAEQTGKAFGRAILFAGETAMEVFPLIAGREDMRRVIAKELTKFKATHPEHTETVDKFLKEDDFKEHDRWSKPPSQQQELKKAPLVSKDPAKPGEMTINLVLPQGKAWEAVRQIAALDTGVRAPGNADYNFAHVDNMQLVGVVGPNGETTQNTFNAAQALIETIKESQEAMWQVMGQIAGRATAASATQKANEILHKFSGAQDPVEQAIKPMAEEVVRKTEEAFAALEKASNVPAELSMPISAAHNAIQRALQKAGKPWGERALASRPEAGTGLAAG